MYINSSNLGVNSSNFLCTVFPVFCSFPMYPIFFRPNGPRIRDPRIKLSLFPIFRAERSLIAPFSVTSSVPHNSCAPAQGKPEKNKKTFFLKGVVKKRMYHQMQKTSPRLVVHPQKTSPRLVVHPFLGPSP